MSDAIRRLGESRVRVAIAIAALAAVVTAIVLVAVWPKSEADSQTLFGFNNNAVSYNQATPDQAAALIAASGGEIDRVQIEWASFEPRPGERRFATFDAIYRADIAHGVKPLFILSSAPTWATDAECATLPDPCHAAPSREHFADAARTAAAIAKRYPRAAGIEVWNEPNAPFFWAPTPDPVAYARLLAKVYKRVKRANPDMQVAGGATSSGSPTAAPPGHIDAPEFVAAIRARRALRHMDALSLHAYSEQTDATGQTAVENVEAVRAALGNRSKPIWVTETGITTTGPTAASEEAQALTMVRLAELLPQIPGVRMVLVHTLIEPPRGALSPETGFGVVRANGQPKPGYCSLVASWGGNAAC